MRDIISHILKVFIAVMIGVEVSLPPNPYADYLVILLVVYIILNNRIDDRINDKLFK